MPKATLLFRSHLVYPDGALREMVIWRLPKADQEHPYGLKYRLYYGSPDGRCMIRYDNERGKGDHRHFCGKEARYHFRDVETLVADFQRDVNRVRRSS